MRVLALSPAGVERRHEHMALVREPLDEWLASLTEADAELMTSLLAGARLPKSDGYARALM